LELESVKCIKAFDGNSSSVTCIKNVLDDKLISGDDQGSIKIFKIKTGVCLKTINAHASAIYKILLISNTQVDA
jgi:WD40 repeat protein